MKGMNTPAILLTAPPESLISTFLDLISTLTFGIATLGAIAVVFYPFWRLKSASKSTSIS